MFAVSGAWGILCIGLFGGYFVSRYFEQNPKIEPELLVSLLAVFGLGPTGLLLVQNYLQAQLLDPYGAGVFLGAMANLMLRILGITSRRYSIARALLAFSSTNPAVEPYVRKGGFEMADGFALVALKEARRKGEGEVPEGTLKKIRDVVQNIPKITDSKVEPIKRIYGDDAILAFNVRVNVKVDSKSDLEPAFKDLHDGLHAAGLSHSEGYG